MLEKLAKNWQIIRDFVCDAYDLSTVSYNTWLLRMKPASIEGDTLFVSYSSDGEHLATPEWIVNFLNKRYAAMIKVAIEEVTGLKLNVTFTVEENNENTPLFHKEENSSKVLNIYRSARLNPKYTFDNFVVGASNSFAHAAAVSVAENPGMEFNPLFIYGGSGLGKTHLMHAIANHVLRNDPNKKVLYVTAEDFTNELIDSLSHRNKGETSYFKNVYRNVDLLLIDDIQFVIGKESTEREFFYTFNHLYENKKQIVISSDKPPKAFNNLDDRMRSRFVCGLLQEITSPDYETRMAILRKKEEVEGYTVDHQILQYIASNIRTNIRELDGALNKINSYYKLNPTKEVTLDSAKEILKDMINPEDDHKLTPDMIIKIVADHYGVRPEDIRSKKQTKEIVLPRQVSMYFIRLLNDLTLEEVGKLLGGKDHTTVSYGCDKVLRKLSNEEFRENIEIIRKKLSQ
ncbi:MAG: chromosomal replication initiator protein DnaA [Lachnospiraceae bacterium]|nr:chromosomal replication initiator protein DnaA [Lachnospiraceae bacterium]